MRVGLIAKKIGMTSCFDDSGCRRPATILHIENCQVVLHKTKALHGYDAMLIGAGVKKIEKVAKPNKHLFEKEKLQPNDVLKEFRISDDNFLPVGTSISADHYEVGALVNVTGISIGKGFAGVMKRHNFGGLEATHGVSISHRSHGSTGQCQDPGKVFKGKKMAGHMGNQKKTITNTRVEYVNPEEGLLVLRGCVVGSKGSYVFVNDAFNSYVSVA